MNLGYVKSEIYNLGFSSEGDVEEGIVIQAINRAINTIASTVRPIVGSHVINSLTPRQDMPDKHYNFYDFKAIAQEKQETFLAFADKFVMGDNLKPVKDFYVLNRSILQLPILDKGEYLIYYIKLYAPITQETNNSTQIELDADLHVLVPLLAAFYVWQDDEERKADKWFNDYETKRNDILSRETKVVAYVNGGDGYGC